MKDTFDPHKLDTRTLERALKRGVISRKDYEKSLKTLPDAEAKAQPVTTRQPNAVTDDDE